MKKNTSKDIWFKAKIYGWGWYPVSWQGWLAVVVYTLFIIKIAVKAESSPDTILTNFFIPIIIATSLLIAVGFWKGEKPEWRWGDPKKTSKKN